MNSQPSHGPEGCQLWLGTSGYSYTEWVDGGFYPRGTRAAQMLPVYAERFPVTEINHTWYQMPRAEATSRQMARAPAGFLFAAKLTRSLTHEVDPDRWREQAALYREGIAPLAQRGQLAAVLVQWPNRFSRSPDNRRYLANLLDTLRGLPLAVEFRHSSWANDRVFAELERRKVSLVTVDAPPMRSLFPSLDVVTNPALIYTRFHGRNGEGWYSGSKQTQFDYDYDDGELGSFIDERLASMVNKARRGLIFFNNHVAAQAPRNAESLQRMLRTQGFSVVGAESLVPAQPRLAL